MAMELTFSESTLGWRFSHTVIFLRHFIEQWLLLQDVQLKNLDEYWNLEQASGVWLNQIGELFTLARPLGLVGNQFILDIDHLDDPSVFLDGEVGEILDKTYRYLIQLRNVGVNKLFCMKNIAELMQLVFGPENIQAQFRENVDILGRPREHYFQILLTFKNSDDYRIFVGIAETNLTLFFGKGMGVSYDVYCEWNPDL